MTDLPLDRFRAARAELEKLNLEISHCRKLERLAMDARVELWRELDQAGVKRSTISKWSAIDPMSVSRALNGLPDSKGE